MMRTAAWIVLIICLVLPGVATAMAGGNDHPPAHNIMQAVTSTSSHQFHPHAHGSVACGHASLVPTLLPSVKPESGSVPTDPFCDVDLPGEMIAPSPRPPRELASNSQAATRF